MTEIEVRLAIANQIKLALNDLYVTQNVDSEMQVTVQDHWIITSDLSTSAAALRALDGTDVGKIHGWTVGLNSLEKDNEVVGQDLKTLFRINRGCDPNSIRETGGNRRQVFATFKIWAFVDFNIGNIDEESSINSENVLSRELEAVSKWFSKNPNLGLVNANGFAGHTELQFKQISVWDFGESTANGAKGTISCAWYEHLI